MSDNKQQPDASKKPRFDAAKVRVPGWQPHTVNQSKLDDNVINHFSLWVPANTRQYSSDVAAVAVEVFETDSPDQAERLTILLANKCQIGATIERTDVGDIGYVGADGIPVVFKRANFAVCVMQAESAQVPALAVARAIDDDIARLI